MQSTTDSKFEELPEYLQEVVAEAKDYNQRASQPVSVVASEVVGEYDRLAWNGRGRDNLEVLGDLRDAGCLCADELQAYRKRAIATKPSARTVEAICLRSLEELIHKSLSEQ
jgi:hypothetical protein